jgi:hypothetical protein
VGESDDPRLTPAGQNRYEVAEQRERLAAGVPVVDVLAEVEAGWTLGKPWKAFDEADMEVENRCEIAEMLARWQEVGIVVRFDREVGR